MNFIFASPIAWDNSGGAHRPVQFAQELARRGHSVTYLEVEKSRARPEHENPRVLNLQDLGWDELNVVRAWYGFNYAAGQDAARRLCEYLPAPHAQSVVLCSAPFRPVLELLPVLFGQGYVLVYDALDDISEMRALGSFCYDEVAEQYLVAHSRLVVTLSPRLREKFRAHPNVVLIRDGVDLAPFRVAQDPKGFPTPPVDKLANAQNPLGLNSLARGDITLGFWGTMWDYNLDVPLVQTLTRARPQWQWHFIGAYDLDPARPSIVAQLAAPNVHFHPSVPRPELAQSATQLDVCILPTPVTPFNLARDPLKVYEYLACGKPVVATDLEQLEGMPYVYRSRDAEEFLMNVERAAYQDIDRAMLHAYLQDQTWTKRTDQLLNALASLSFQPYTIPPPPRGAMPGAENDLARWQAFGRHLERIVRDRESHVGDLEAALQQSSVASKLKRVIGR